MQHVDEARAHEQASGSKGRDYVHKRDYEAVVTVHRSPEIQFLPSDQLPLPQRTSDMYASGGVGPSEGRTRRDHSHVNSEFPSINRSSSLDYSASMPHGIQRSSSQIAVSSGSAFTEHQNSALSHSNTYPVNVVDRSHDNLTPVSNNHYGGLDSVTGARGSPSNFDLSLTSKDKSGSRVNSFEGRSCNDAFIPQKTFEAYPNPYGEPLEVGDPLVMMRYEDVAMFKSIQEPSSQVSSSTDSGYGHSHHIYERVGDFNRQSGQ